MPSSVLRKQNLVLENIKEGPNKSKKSEYVLKTLYHCFIANWILELLVFKYLPLSLKSQNVKFEFCSILPFISLIMKTSCLFVKTDIVEMFEYLSLFNEYNCATCWVQLTKFWNISHSSVIINKNMRAMNVLQWQHRFPFMQCICVKAFPWKIRTY